MDLSGKNVLFLGSSVTYGEASGGVSFVEIMAEQCGFFYVKEAVSGTTLADIDEKSYVSRLKKIDTDLNFDLFICQLSTNDSYKNVPTVDTENAIVEIIEYVKKHFDCPVMFYTGTRFNTPEYGKHVELINFLKDKYGFYLLDLWNDKKMQNIDKELYNQYMRDTVHPTLLGYKEWWTPKFIEFCEKVIADRSSSIY